MLQNADMTLNFGATPFKFSPPAGYAGISALPSGDTTRAVVASTTAGSRSSRQPVAVIIEPSRDLAQQTHEAVMSLARFVTAPQIACGLFVGGIPVKEQMEVRHLCDAYV